MKKTFILLLSLAVSAASQAPVVSFGILPFQDESGAQASPELLARLSQDFLQKMNSAYVDVLVRPVAVPPETAVLGIDQMAALGKQQGMKFVLRGGLISWIPAKTETGSACRVGLFVQLIDSESAASASFRANGEAADDNAAIEAAFDQLIPQVYQAAMMPAAPTEPVAVPEDPAVPAVIEEPQPEAQAAEEAWSSYESDQELQQLIAQAESLISSGAAAGMDISALQQALETLQNALNNKISLMEQGQDTAAADEEISARKAQLQTLVDGSAQAAVAEPPAETQAVNAEKKNIIEKVNGLLDGALASIQKIQEIRSAVQGTQQEEQAQAEPAYAEEAGAPMEEPTTDVSGVVVDENGYPVEGAVVTDSESGTQAVTDSSGAYLIPRIPGGRFANILVTKNNRLLMSGKLQLLAGKPAFADWKVKPLGGGSSAVPVKILPSSVILTPTKKARASGLGTITGTARDGDGRPVGRALVIIPGVGTARTDSQGRYAFANVAQGSYKVTVQQAGSPAQTFQVKVVAKTTVENKIVVPAKTTARAPIAGTALAKGSGTLLRGTIISEERKALGGAKVTAVPTGGGGIFVLSGGNGIYEFKDLKPGSYRLLVKKSGFQDASQAVVIHGSRSGVANFTLKKTSAQLQKAILSTPPKVRPKPAGTPAGTVAKPPIKTTAPKVVVAPPPAGSLIGQVLDTANRKPIANANVQAGGKTVRTDAQGNYRLAGFPVGNLKVKAGHSDYLSAEKNAVIQAGATNRADFTLKRKETPGLKTAPKLTAPKVVVTVGQVRGRVTDAKTGNSIAQVAVSMNNRTAQTNAAGEYSFSNIPAGNYSLSFKRTGYQNGSGRVTVAAGKTSSADIRLTPLVPLNIRKK